MKRTLHAPQRPLENGQIWRMPQARMQIGLVGKMLVHYKLGKPDAARPSSLVNAKTSVEKYLKANKAVLMRKRAA